MAIDIQGRSPAAASGRSFRPEFWIWRPIHALIAALCADLVDPPTLESMKFGNGGGPVDQATCDAMAARFEKWLADHHEGFVLEAGIRMTPEGRFVTEQELAENASLETISPYEVNPEQIQKWIAFLKTCGGFEVW